MLLVLITNPLFWWTGALEQNRKGPRHNERSEAISIECSKAMGEPPATGRQRLTRIPQSLNVFIPQYTVHPLPRIPASATGSHSTEDPWT